MLENVRNAASSPPESSRHTTIASKLSVHDVIPCLIPCLGIEQVHNVLKLIIQEERA